MSSRERFASASICSKSAIKPSADSPVRRCFTPQDNVAILVVKAFVEAVIGIVADFVSPDSIIETADVREFVHLVVLVVNRLNRSV